MLITVSIEKLDFRKKNYFFMLFERDEGQVSETFLGADQALL